MPFDHKGEYIMLENFDTQKLPMPSSKTRRFLREAAGIAMLAGLTLGAGLAQAAQPQNLYVFYDGAYGAGLDPQSGLMLATDGNYYGTTLNGGINWGTVYQITPAGAVTVVHSFDSTNGDGPAGPVIQTPDGLLWGTTQYGDNQACIYGCGVVFKVHTDGSGYTVVHAFNGNDGLTPTNLVYGSDGQIYGITASDFGTGQGTIFTINPSTGTFKSLYNFRRIVGSGPSSLIEGSDGNLYGTTYYGGALNDGSFFRIAKNGTGVAVLHHFNGRDGEGVSGVIQAHDGSFYGTAFTGGKGSCTPEGILGCGTVFKYDTQGVFSTLYYFKGADGAVPRHGLIEGTDFALYGSTLGGGAYQDSLCTVGGMGCGTTFKLTTTGQLTTLSSFNINLTGEGPQGVIQGADGALYGASESGGLPPAGSGYTFGAGTVFRQAIP